MDSSVVLMRFGAFLIRLLRTHTLLYCNATATFCLCASVFEAYCEGWMNPLQICKNHTRMEVLMHKPQPYVSVLKKHWRLSGILTFF